MEITPETETYLQAVAAQPDLSPEKTTATLSTEQEEMIAELRASEEDHEARRSMTVEEYKVRMRARRQARDAVKDNQ